MNYPCIIPCQQCGKMMAALRPSKKFCSNRCKIKSYRIKNGLPLTWVREKPNPIQRNFVPRQMGGPAMSAYEYDFQVVPTDKGLRKVVFNKKTGEITVFKIEDGKEILIK